MADYSDNDLRYYADRLDAVLHQFTGAGLGNSNTYDRSGNKKSAFHRSMDKATEGLEFMHGSAMTAGHSLRNFLGVSAISGVVTAVVHSLTDMYQTFSKLTDVGFNFGGSMLEMQKQAGDSGLSLDEFARSLGRSSTVVAEMGDAQVQGVKVFADFQKGVRNNLKEFGYYGMTLSQVDDASGDYLDNLRRAGQLTNLTKDQEVNASKDFIQNVNAMAKATGKSREEIMKLTTQALHDPAAAARLSELGPEATKSFLKTASLLSAAMGQAGVDLSHMFAQTIGAKGRTWATEMGDTAIKVGLPGFNSLMEQMANATTSGKPVTRDLFDQIGQMRDLVQSHVDQLLDLRLNPDARAGVDKMLAWLEEMQGYDPKLAFERSEAARKDQMDGVTQAAAMFETNLHDMTAAFRTGLYKGILDLIAPGKDVKDQITAFAKTIDTIKGTLQDFGTVFGTVFGLLIDAMTPAAWLFKQVVSGLGFAQRVIEHLLKPFGLGAVGGGKRIWEQEGGKDKLDENGHRIPVWEQDDAGNDKIVSGHKVQARTEAVNVAKIIGSVAVVGLTGIFALWAKRRLSGKLHMAARDVYLTARGIFGANGQPMFGGGGNGPHAPGAPGAPAGAPVGRFARWKAKLAPAGRFFGSIYGVEAAETLATETGEGVKAAAGKGSWFGPGSGLRMAGSFVARGIVGFIGGKIVGAVLEALPDFQGKEYIESVITWSSIGLSAFAPQLIRGIMGRFGPILSKGVTASVQVPGLIGRLFTPATTSLGAAGKGLGRGLVGYVGGEIIAGVLKYLPDFVGKETLETMLPWAAMGLSLFGPQILRGVTKVVGGMFARAATAAAVQAAAANGAATLIAAAGTGGMGLTAVIGMALPEVAAIVIAAILAKEGLSSFGQWFSQWWSGRNNKEEEEHQRRLKQAYDKLEKEGEDNYMTPAERRRRWEELKNDALKGEAKPTGDKDKGKDEKGDDKKDAVDRKVMSGMYEQLSWLLTAPDARRDDAMGGGDRENAFAQAIQDVHENTAKTYLTAPINEQTDTFAELNQRLLDTMALISIDQEKQDKAPDPKLAIEIQNAQLEQLRLQNALLYKGNQQREDAKRGAAVWQ